MREAGLTAEKIETAGHPLIYAEWLNAPGKPTVLFYGHYDVQPVDPIEEWRNPPFEPTVEGDHLVARGATDDKGQSFAHLKAVEAMLAERGKLPVNVKFIIEGEEESGGASIDAFVEADARGKLACDCVVISDSSMYSPELPSLLYGLRGLAYMEVRVTGPNHDLHSGSFGGAVSNPLNALGDIVASLRDPKTGRILIPHFYDDVRPLADWERKEFAKLPCDEAAYMKEIGVTALLGEEGFSTRERTWARPTCDVNGIWGGYQGKGAKTVLPSKAGAKISMRLVPDQDPAKIAELFAAHVKAAAPAGVTVEVERAARRRSGADRGRGADHRGRARRHGGDLGGAAGARARGGLDPHRRHLRRGPQGAGAAARLRPRTTTASTRPTRSSTSATSTAASAPPCASSTAWGSWLEGEAEPRAGAEVRRRRARQAARAAHRAGGRAGPPRHPGGQLGARPRRRPGVGELPAPPAPRQPRRVPHLQGAGELRGEDQAARGARDRGERPGGDAARCSRRSATASSSATRRCARRGGWAAC